MLLLTSFLSLIVIACSSFYFFSRVYQNPVASTAALPNKISKESNTKDEIESSKPQAKVFFGSQTGTAEGFAKDICSEMMSHGCQADVVDLDDFDSESFVRLRESTLCIFVVATYGEGDPPDNAVEFNKWLSAQEDDKLLCGMNISIFGLGNREYEHYNGMGKFIRQKMLSLGASEFCKYGEGDDSEDIEEDFDDWFESFKVSCAKIIGIEPGKNTKTTCVDKDIPKENFITKFLTTEEINTLNLPDEYLYHFGAFNRGISPRTNREVSQNNGNCYTNVYLEPKEVELKNRHFFNSSEFRLKRKHQLRLSPGDDGFGSTVHLEFEKPKHISFQTADNFAICAENNPNLVAEFASLLGLTKFLDTWISFEPNYEAGFSSHFSSFPSPTTLRTVFSAYVAINQIPLRSTLSKLSGFATIKQHKQRLKLLSSKEGHEEYHRVIVGRGRDLVETIEMFPSINATTILPALGKFIDALPKLQPRYYTISSSQLKYPDSIHTTVSVVTEKKTGMPGLNPRIFRGVCSSFLDGLTPGLSVLGHIRRSTFKLPADTSTPLILVGPGTGIAPLRAFLQEREARATNEELSECVLFFGCRRRNEDYIYEEELRRYLDTEVLTKLYVAFSRETNKKEYVQHLIRRESNHLWSLLEEKKASVFVCGGTQMGRDVMHAFQEIVRERIGLDSSDAGAKYIKNLVDSNRYIQELWSA